MSDFITIICKFCDGLGICSFGSCPDCGGKGTEDINLNSLGEIVTTNKGNNNE